ncbi:MAG: hypothetical protein HY763_16635 [Planctomycetes bacterium]|nr:hypothetical protein [Planctomycetota bacterium]
MKRLFRRIALAAALLLPRGYAAAAPTADLVSSSWQLDFHFHDPQRIAVLLPGDRQPTTFWYMLFRVVNHTGRDVEFFPSFTIVTDTLQVVVGGDEVHPSVYDAIASRHRNDAPFFAPPSKITGPLLQGDENGRTSAAVFRPFDPRASRFTVYIGGLSGEMTRVASPMDAEAGDRVLGAEPDSAAAAKPVESAGAFLLRRTLAVGYDLPGDPTTRALAAPVRRSREWVMR